MSPHLISEPLNAEPADPKERRRKHLPPKSFADAAHESLEDEKEKGESQTNNSSEAKDTSTQLINGHTEEEEEVELEQEAGGLTSVRSNPVYEESLEHSVAVAPHIPTTSSSDSQVRQRRQKEDLSASPLKSGRQAGKGWQESAVRWAPLNVPVQRRLQTLAVLWHTLSIAVFLSLFFFLAAIPLTWPLLIPYLIYTLIFSHDPTNGTLKRRSPFLRRSKIWSAFASYFPARLHRTVELQPTRKYIFGYHPHGIISHGAFAAFGTEALGFSELFPGITNTLLTLESNFRIPLYRDYALAMGLASVSKESITNILSKGGVNQVGMGRAVTIVVGGARESLDAQPYKLRLVLNSRKGFVKLAIRLGADLVPVLAFGENELYDQVDSETHPFIHRFQMVVKKAMGFTVPLFHARGIFNYDVGLMPYRRAVNVVVGRPIEVRQQGAQGEDGASGKVDEDYLDQVHGQYIDELKRLWERYKDEFARDRQGELEIVE